MKKFPFSLVILIPILCFFTGCFNDEKKNADMSQKGHIALVQFAPHPALDEEARGVKDAIAEYNKKNNASLTIVYENAHGNMATLQQIVSKVISQKPDVVAAIATPAAQSFKKICDQKNIPLIFTAVSDARAAKLLVNAHQPEGLVTGVEDSVPVNDIIKMIMSHASSFKKIGILYNAGEINSVNLVEGIKTQAPSYGLEVITATVARTSDVKEAMETLTHKVDAIFLPQDNLVVSAIAVIVKQAKLRGIPVFTADLDLYDQGVTAAIGYPHHAMGYKAGEMAIRALDENIASIPAKHGLELTIKSHGKENNEKPLTL